MEQPSMGRMWEKIKFCRDMGGDEVPFRWRNSVQFFGECVGGETLVLLSDAGLQQQMQFAPREGLNEQFLRPLTIQGALFCSHHGERRVQPLREADGSAELINLGLMQFHRHLDPALPATFFDVIDGRVGEGFTLHLLRSDEQRHTELR